MLDFIFGNPEKERMQRCNAKLSQLAIADAQQALSDAKCNIKAGLGQPLTWLSLGMTSEDLANIAWSMKTLGKQVEPLTSVYHLALNSSGVVTINANNQDD